MEFILIFIGIIFIYLIGYMFLDLLEIEFNIFEKLGFSFGIGSIFVFLQLFIYLGVSIPIVSINLFVPWVVIATLYFYFRRNNKVINLTNITLDLNLLQYFLIFLIFISILLLILESLTRPLMAWDAVANWYMLSKAYYSDHGITQGLYRFLNIDNPYFMSIMHLYIYGTIGVLDESKSFILYVMFVISSSMVLFGFTKRVTSLNYALIFTFLYLTVPNVIRQGGTFDIGYSDIVLSYFVFTSVLSAVNFGFSRKVNYVFLASLFSGAAVITKSEGIFVFLLVNLYIVYHAYKYNLLRLIYYLSPGILIYISWIVFKYIYSVPTLPYSIQLTGSVFGTFDIFKSVNVARAFIFESINIIRWNFLLLVFIVAVFIKKKNNISHINYLTLTLLFMYLGVFVFTPFNVDQHLVGILDRFILQTTPLLVLLICQTYYNIFSNHEE